MPMTTLCERDAAAAARDDDRLAEPVEPVDGEDDVGGLRRRGRAASTDRDADVGERERGRVVDAVADHDRGPGAVLEPDGFHLLGRGALGEHVVDADHRTDHLRVLLAVAGHHDDAAEPVAAQLPDRSGGVRPDRVVEQERADLPAVHVDEDRERAVEAGAAPHALRPRRARVGLRPARLPHRDPVAVDHAPDARGRVPPRRRRATATGGRGRVRRARPPPRGRAATPGRGWPRSAARRRPASRRRRGCRRRGG